jgi:hypothetical protein
VAGAEAVSGRFAATAKMLLTTSAATRTAVLTSAAAL